MASSNFAVIIPLIISLLLFYCSSIATTMKASGASGSNRIGGSDTSSHKRKQPEPNEDDDENRKDDEPLPLSMRVYIVDTSKDKIFDKWRRENKGENTKKITPAAGQKGIKIGTKRSKKMAKTEKNVEANVGQLTLKELTLKLRELNNTDEFEVGLSPSRPTEDRWRPDKGYYKVTWTNGTNCIFELDGKWRTTEHFQLKIFGDQKLLPDIESPEFVFTEADVTTVVVFKLSFDPGSGTDIVRTIEKTNLAKMIEHVIPGVSIFQHPHNELRAEPYYLGQKPMFDANDKQQLQEQQLRQQQTRLLLQILHQERQLPQPLQRQELQEIQKEQRKQMIKQQQLNLQQHIRQQMLLQQQLHLLQHEQQPQQQLHQERQQMLQQQQQPHLLKRQRQQIMQQLQPQQYLPPQLQQPQQPERKQQIVENNTQETIILPKGSASDRGDLHGNKQPVVNDHEWHQIMEHGKRIMEGDGGNEELDEFVNQMIQHSPTRDDLDGGENGLKDGQRDKGKNVVIDESQNVGTQPHPHTRFLAGTSSNVHHLSPLRHDGQSSFYSTLHHNSFPQNSMGHHHQGQPSNSDRTIVGGSHLAEEEPKGNPSEALDDLHI